MPTILVVDDNHVLRSVMQRRLTREGMNVLIAANGEEGVELAQSIVPDLILMDMTMPVMDGWTATRLLRQNPATSHIPIVAFTAQPMGAAGDDPARVQYDGHIAKPFQFPEALREIQRLLEGLPPREGVPENS